MKDRLLELHTKIGASPTAIRSTEDQTKQRKVGLVLNFERETQNYENKEQNKALLPLVESGTSDDNNLVKFGQKEKSIKEALWQLKPKLEELKSLHNSLLMSPSNNPETRGKAEQLIKVITTKLNKVGSQIKEFNQAAQDKFKANELSNTEHRIVCNVNNSLTNDFRMILEELNEVRNSYEERSIKRILRQLEIAGYPIEEKEAEDALANGTPIFLREFAECEAAKLALRDLQDRHNELIQIEKSIAEVHHLFMEFSLFVATQGELVDNIERNVTGAVSSVKHGKTRLVKAKAKQRAARRKKIILTSIVFIIVFILVIVIIIQFVK